MNGGWNCRNLRNKMFLEILMTSVICAFGNCGNSYGHTRPSFGRIREESLNIADSEGISCGLQQIYICSEPRSCRRLHAWSESDLSWVFFFFFLRLVQGTCVHRCSQMSHNLPTEASWTVVLASPCLCMTTVFTWLCICFELDQRLWSSLGTAIWRLAPWSLH